MTPFAKTGGLADVAGSLPPALGQIGVETAVFMPRYRGLPKGRKRIADRVTVYFVENEAYFNRSSLYGNERGDYADNLDRFSFFSDRVLSLAKEIGFKPDVLHCNDWHTALIPVRLKTASPRDKFFKKTKTLLTIHNLAYQGLFPAAQYSRLGFGRNLFSEKGFEFHGRVNFLKAGILFADAVSTVSPTYAREIQTAEHGCGLQKVLRKREGRLKGILNGIDTDYWNPARDRAIASRYSRKSLAGKTACKASLQKENGLEVNADIPVFGIVSRLASQKGVDLLSEIADSFLAEPVQFVLLGEGDAAYERAFGNIGRRYPKKAAVHLGFNAAGAHGIYAGSDFFLMPSVYEPCGLGQLISLRYGTLPIVRRTGGLADTIRDIDRDPKKGNGFVFQDHRAEKFLQAIRRAIRLFREKKRLETLRKRAMALDFSWQHSAGEYKKFYKKIIGG